MKSIRNLVRRSNNMSTHTLMKIFILHKFVSKNNKTLSEEIAGNI